MSKRWICGGNGGELGRALRVARGTAMAEEARRSISSRPTAQSLSFSSPPRLWRPGRLLATLSSSALPFAMQDSPPSNSAAPARRTNRDRDPAQPTDLADRIVALQRRQAAVTKPRERAERPPLPSSSTLRPRPPSPRRLHAPLHPNPSIIVSQSSSSAMEADADDFSRRLKISASSPRTSHAKPHAGPSGSPGKLYNPNADYSRRPILTAEPDTISDAASSSYAPRGPAPHGPRAHQPPAQSRAAPDAHRQLFDHRKDDPVKFSVLTRPQASSNVGGSPSSGRPTPTPKSSGDYVSASSTSSASYAHSTISSNFTLSSATTDSSAPSSLFDNAGHARRSEDSASSTNAFSMQLKKLYRAISALEAKILGEDRDKDREDDGERDVQRVGVLLKGRPGPGGTETKVGEDESERWRRLMIDHKELAEKMHQMLTLTLAPAVPASLRNIPTKYNLIIRLWTHAFHRLLESLRRAATPPNNSPIALEYLQDFIYYSYAFYSGLLEERNLFDFRSTWVEALGDLARYRMATCALLDNMQAASSSITPSGAAPLLNAHLSAPQHVDPEMDDSSDKPAIPAGKPVSPTPAARIDDSPPSSPDMRQQQQDVPSVGLAAARMMELEPEKERWRQIARDWFARGLSLTPGTGKLHHHLGLLSREEDASDEELRALYHFVKSMIALHPFSKARESILQLWSPAAQARRQLPEAGLTELFVALHGMLFTNIQLDDFRRVLERFEEKLYIEESAAVQERDWIMMAIVNLGAVLEYGRPNAAMRRVSGLATRDAHQTKPGVSPMVANAVAGKVKLMAKRAEEDEKSMDVDDEDDTTEPKPSPMRTSPIMPEPPSSPELPQSLKMGLLLSFSMFAHVLEKPMRKPSPFAHSTLNPYITIFLTFLATTVKDSQTLAALERVIPWTALVKFLNSAPRRLIFREYHKERGDAPPLLTSGCNPMPEDWCLRGMGWGGKRVYPMGFWSKEADSGERNIEMEVLDKVEAGDQRDGIIEKDDDDSRADSRDSELMKRWVRIARAGLKIAKYVNGFEYIPPAREEERGQWRIGGALAAKVTRWQDEDRREREEEERRLRGRRWDDDSMDVDDDEGLAADTSSDDTEDDEYDSAEVKALKARRRYLKSLQTTSRGAAPSAGRRQRPRQSNFGRSSRPKQSVRAIPGYSVLVFDTNILLSSLPAFSSLVESLQWTVVVPLPVIMELDGLTQNQHTELGSAAGSALQYITTHFRSHGKSLKVQTSKGNYLNSLTVRTEQVDFTDEASWERNMDDLILRATIWQDEHWIDRSNMLQPGDGPRDTTGAAKVVLLTFDRMLRLKARSRQLSAANEQDLATILSTSR
ncbi:predicted protein [Postia placenta Mad-698-R]|nr:predicted protein [Postia placenta Mad-698-R]